VGTVRSTGPVGVAIRSDRRLYRDVLAAWLADQAGFTVVGHVADDVDLLELCRLRAPELVLFDAVAGADASLGLLRELRDRWRHTRVVMVYEDLSPAELAAAGRVGVERLVPCSHGLPALLAVLREYAGTVRDPARPAAARSQELAGSSLSAQEREVLTLVASGHPVNRIAAMLRTSAHAVEHSKRRIYAKLHAVNQSHAIARAAALGIVDRLAPRPRAGAPVPGARTVLLRGPAGSARQRVVVALLSRRLAVAVDGPGAPGIPDHWPLATLCLVLVDPRPRDWDGVDGLAMPVLWICTGPAPRELARIALERGVAAVLPTERIEELLVPALTLAGAGCLTLGPQLAAELVAMLGSGIGGPGTELPALTVRESQILRSIAAGDTVRQTARGLGITQKTVENTQARLFRKLGVRNRAATLARASELGLLDLSREARSAAYR
jgi:two-component system, NarL family, nitrate/nitrite response regulator NarL